MQKHKVFGKQRQRQNGVREPHNKRKDKTHSDEVNQHQSEAWPYGHERRGHNPAKKNLLRLLCLALLARCATGTPLTTECSHINRKKERKIHRLLLRQIQMNSDDRVRSLLWNPQIPDTKLHEGFGKNSPRTRKFRMTRFETAMCKSTDFQQLETPERSCGHTFVSSASCFRKKIVCGIGEPLRKEAQHKKTDRQTGGTERVVCHTTGEIKQAPCHANCSAEHRRPESLANVPSTSGLCENTVSALKAGHQPDGRKSHGKSVSGCH